MDSSNQPSAYELALEWVNDLAKPSNSGQGGDDALFNAACVLYHGFDLREGALDALRHYNGVKCSPPWNEARLQYKLKQAAGAAQKHPAGGLFRWMLRRKGLRTVYRGDVNGRPPTHVAAEPRMELPKKLEFDLKALAREVRDISPLVDEEWLVRNSPVRVDDIGPVEFLNALYRKGEKVLIFTDFYSQGQFAHRIGGSSWRLSHRPDMKGVKSELPKTAREGIWFLSQPIDGEWHLNPRSLDENGHPKNSRRSEESVTSWRYMVLESDDAPGNLWIRYLVKLPLTISAIYTSGGRSIHALVRVDAPNKPWWDQVKHMISGLITKLGADPGALTAVRLTRLPFCYREGGKDENDRYVKYANPRFQRLLYLDPNPEENTPIIWREGVMS